MENDHDYLALIERFSSVLGGPNLTGHPSLSVPVPELAVMAQIGEKRARPQEEPEAQPSKKKRISGDWLVVLKSYQAQRKQRYVHSTSDERLREHFLRGAAKEEYIRCVSSSANKQWAVIIDGSTGYTDQVYKLSEQPDKDWIMEHWKDSYYITAIASDRSRSLTVMSKGGNDFVQQVFKLGKKSFPYHWVRMKWREGFFITSVACIGRGWFVVASKTSMFSDQIVEFDCEYNKNRMERLRGRGFEITEVVYSRKMGVAVLSRWKDKPAAFQELIVGHSFPGDAIKVGWAGNMYVAALGYERTKDTPKTSIRLMRT